MPPRSDVMELKRSLARAEKLSAEQRSRYQCRMRASAQATRLPAYARARALVLERRSGMPEREGMPVAPEVTVATPPRGLVVISSLRRLVSHE